MSRKVSRISTLFLVLGLASVATIFFSIQKSATANIRQPLNINVDDGMLQKYRELSTLSINERKDHFRIASAKDRSDLWKTHFAEYIKTHPDLTQDQLKIIEEGVDLASPIIFGMPDNAAVKKAVIGEALLKLKEHALVAFSHEEAKKLFAVLGGEVTPSDKFGRAPKKDTCPCSTQDPWCGGSTCWGNNGECSSSNSGCGTLWQYQCNGSC